MRVGYVLNEFPSDTEYFILHEMMELQRVGITPVILRLNFTRQAADPRHPAWENQFEIVDLRPWFSPVRWLRCASWVLRSPVRILKALNNVSGSTLSFRALLRECLNLLRAIDLADQTTALDHIHAHFANSPTEVGLLISVLKGLPFSFSTHARDLFAEGRDLERKISCSRFVVTCTEYNKRFIQQEVSASYHQRIHAIYHGIDPALWDMRTKDPHNDEFVILTVGRLVEKKGIQVALKALKHLDTGGRKVRYIIVGDGPERVLLEAMSREIDGISVAFTGALLQEEVRKYMQTADLVLHPAIVAQDGDRDGIPNVLLEAMASGVPVVLAARTSLPEVCGDAGTYAAPEDAAAIAGAIDGLLGDQQLYAGKKAAGLKRAAEFTWTGTAMALRRSIDNAYKSHI